LKYVNFSVEQGTCLVIYNYICYEHINRSKRLTFQIVNRILLRAVRYISTNTNMIYFFITSRKIYY